MEVYHLLLKQPLLLHFWVPFFLQQLEEKLQLLQQPENVIVEHHYRLTFNFTSNPLLGIIYGSMSAAPDSPAAVPAAALAAVPAAAVAAAPAEATSSFRP